MEICIKIENPNEKELFLIGELSKIGYEKMISERKYMEDTLLTKMPEMYQNLMKKE